MGQRMMMRGALASIPLLLCLAAGAMAAPASKTFRDWAAGCDNLFGCTALSLPVETDPDVAYLKLERPGGAAGEFRLTLRVRAEGLTAPQAAQLSLDGTPFPAEKKPLSATTVDEEGATFALASADAEALIAAARKATKLTVFLSGKLYDVSLNGSVAAMLWIDEQQGRLGTTSALVRKGPSVAVPPAPILPVVLAKPTDGLPALDARTQKSLASALRKTLTRADRDLCEAPDPDMTDSAWPLGGTLRLVGLVCSRGAYNVASGFWLVNGTDVTKARKVAFPQLGGTPDNGLTNADFDPKTGVISYFNKARGIGDCGTLGSYAWTGSTFAMTALSEMGECRGIGADDWPTLFRSEVKVVR